MRKGNIRIKHGKKHHPCSKRWKHRTKCRRQGKHHHHHHHHHHHDQDHDDRRNRDRNDYRNRNRDGRHNQDRQPGERRNDNNDSQEEYETRPDRANRDRGKPWKIHERTIDDWSMRRRKDHRRTTEFKDGYPDLTSKRIIREDIEP
ncbi:unnamed protein product [Rotaria sp. Silwood1]|nr:unnamed protein product [Rotaria sp. Silwood1]CAF1263019.1 unnamed protein product [Rotaria sp. Silwood1]